MLRAAVFAILIAATAAPAADYWISEVSQDGSLITLSDGSVWSVDLLGQLDSMLWLPTEDIIVYDKNCLIGQAILINTENDGEKVHATLIKDGWGNIGAGFVKPSFQGGYFDDLIPLPTAAIATPRHGPPSTQPQLEPRAAAAPDRSPPTKEADLDREILKIRMEGRYRFLLSNESSLMLQLRRLQDSGQRDSRAEKRVSDELALCQRDIRALVREADRIERADARARAATEKAARNAAKR